MDSVSFHASFIYILRVTSAVPSMEMHWIVFELFEAPFRVLQLLSQTNAYRLFTDELMRN
jgi:hypothetical protein